MPIQVRAFPYNLPHDPTKTVVRDAATFEAMLNEMRAAKVRIIDFETSGLNWFLSARAVGIALGYFDAQGRVRAWYVPFRHQTAEFQLDIARIGPALAALLADDDVLWIAHNAKFDTHIARAEGWRLGGQVFCTLVGARLYDGSRLAGLKLRAQTDLGEPQAAVWEEHLEYHIKRLAKQYGCGIEAYRARFGYAQIPVEVCGHYACFDIEYTGRLYHLYVIKEKLPEKMPRVVSMEMALSEVLVDMEEAGMRVDTAYLSELRETVLSKQDDLEHRVWQAFPQARKFDLSNDNQRRNFLQRDLQLPLFKKTRGGILSVDREVLDYFTESVPDLALVADWCDAQKIATTYTSSILEKLDSRDVLHCNYHQLGAATGRMSSSGPNLQNIASDSDIRAKATTGRDLENGGEDPWSVRRAFTMRDKGWVRLYFDYSQIELRVLTWYTQDPIFLDSYRKGEDVHARTSLEVFGTAEQAKRRQAKVINFGLVYGFTHIGLSKALSVTEEEATEFMRIYFSRYVGVPKFRDKFLRDARRAGGTFANAWGRLRHLPELNSRDFWERSKAERKSFASLIQGQAAELTKESLVRLWRWIKAEKIPAFLVNVIHDEIQIDVPMEYVARVVRMARHLMEYYPEFGDVPILTDAKYTKRHWAESYSKANKIHLTRSAA